MAQVRCGFGEGGWQKDGSGGGGVRTKPTGILEFTSEDTRFLAFDDKRRLVAALATDFALGALIVALTRPKRIEIEAVVVSPTIAGNHVMSRRAPAGVAPSKEPLFQRVTVRVFDYKILNCYYE
jgi:hypothetical protein